MSPEKEKVDAAFVRIVARQKAEGIDVLTVPERAILHIYHSIGIIENGGLARYLFVIDDLFAIDEVIAELFDLGLADVALVIKRGALLLLNYLREHSNIDPPDYKGFNMVHHTELSQLENQIYASESQIINALHGLLKPSNDGGYEA